MNILTDYLAELIHAQFEFRKPAPIPEGIEIDKLIQLSEKGHMDYLILGALLKVDGLSEQYISVLRSKILTSVSKTMMQVNELREMDRRFEEKGIVNQPMKGARMRFLYPSPEMREMSDIDVLIHADSMEKAATELQDMGYSLHKSIHHHDIYTKYPYMIIEAHRAMYDKTVDKNQYEYFTNFSKAQLMENHKYTYDFNAEDFYIYLIAHMAKHFYTMGCGIRNLLDIYVYLKQKGAAMDRVYVDSELEKLGLLTFTKQMEELAFVWMEKKQYTEFQQQIFDYMLDGGIYGKDENGIWNKFSEEKMDEKEVSRKKLRKWYFFPPLSYMKEYYSWLEKYPCLLPAAWLIRACKGLFEKKGIYKREMIRDIPQEQIQIYKKIYQAMELHFK